MLSHRQSLLFLAPLALVLLPFLLGPALFGLAASLTSYAPTAATLHIVGLRHYRAVLNDPAFQAALRNIALFVLAAVPAELAGGFALAYALRAPFRGRAALRMLLLVPWLVSPVASGVMWHFLLSGASSMPNAVLALLHLPPQPSPLGIGALALLTTILLDIWRKAPLAGFLLLPGLLAIPSAQWDHAALDGLPLLSRVRHVALPPLRPLLLTVALLLTGDTLGTFDSVLILTGGGPGTRTLTPALYSYQQAFQGASWPLGVASAWLIALAVLLVGACYAALSRDKLTGKRTTKARAHSVKRRRWLQ